VHSDSLNRALFSPLRNKPQRDFYFRFIFIRRRHLEIDFHKSGGLVPAIIQDERSGDVLMLAS